MGNLLVIAFVGRIYEAPLEPDVRR